MERRGRAPRILLIENDAAIRQVLIFFLKQSGFEVLDVSDGGEAKSRLSAFDPDLIIFDLVVRPPSGWEVLQWLRHNHWTPRIPVLVISELTQIEEQVHGFEEGAIEYLTKPTQPSLIVERVREILALSQQQRTMLQHMRINQQRKTLQRIYAAQRDDFF